MRYLSSYLGRTDGRTCGVVERPDHHCGDDLVSIIELDRFSSTISWLTEPGG